MSRSMSDESPTEDVLGDCFEPRDETANFTDVTLRPYGEENEADTSLSIIVCDPEKYAAFLETYLRYRVKTQSSREEFKSKAHEVFRRYSDFLWLRDRLEETHPTLVIPPFPPKHSMSAFERFSGPFIHARCAALQRFMTRVAQHPMLSSCNDLFNFLTLEDQEEWIHYKQEFKPAVQWLSKIKDFVQAGETAPEFEYCLPKIEVCTEAVDRITTTCRHMMDEEQWEVKELSQLAGALSKWSSESGHVPRVGSILYHLAQAFDARAKDLLPTTFFLQTNFIPEMLDLVAYADSVKKVVVRRDKLQGIIRDMNDSSQKLEESLDRSNPVTRKVFGQSVESERLQKEEKLYQLRNRSESLRRSLEGANCDLSTELDTWSRQRSCMIRRALLDLAGQRLAHHRQMEQLWSQTLENIEVALSRG